MSDTIEESTLVTYARDELQRAGLFDEDSDYGGMLGEGALELVKLFSTQGHSGMSAGKNSAPIVAAKNTKMTKS